MAGDTQILIPKATLPNCQVGETLVLVSEDEENFIAEVQYEEEAVAGDEEMPAAVKAVMGAE